MNILGVSDQERMDSCRHDSASANIIYQERDSISEANKFIALGIKPSKKMRLADRTLITPESSTPTPTTKPTSTSPNKKLHYYEISLTPPTTQIESKSSPSPNFSMTQPTEYPLTLPTSDSLTQDAIAVVQRNIDMVRKSFPPSVSERHQAVLKMGQEVNELKDEVVFLRDSLQNSLSHQELLKRRISYFEQREEAELIRQSREFEEEKEAFERKNRYYPPSTYSSNCNFSATFNRK